MGGGDIVFGTGALVAVGLYLVSMIGVGYYARGKRETNSMAAGGHGLGIQGGVQRFLLPVGE